MSTGKLILKTSSLSNLGLLTLLYTVAKKLQKQSQILNTFIFQFVMKQKVIGASL